MVKKKTVSLNKLQTKGKTFIIAYDQGLEHGPEHIKVGKSTHTIDPEYVFNIAAKGKFHGFAVHKGLAEKYGPYFKSVKLIIKLNGKTQLLNGDPYSPQICSVKRAVELGAIAVGYTIYVGSEHEARMFAEFAKIQEEAHSYGIPVIAWMYPRGKAIKNDLKKEVLTYAARVGLELGADIVKMKFNGKIPDLKEQILSAGKTKLICAGGSLTSDKVFLSNISKMTSAGVDGFAVGRNIWMHKDPLKIANQVHSILFSKK